MGSIFEFDETTVPAFDPVSTSLLAGIGNNLAALDTDAEEDRAYRFVLNHTDLMDVEQNGKTRSKNFGLLRATALAYVQQDPARTSEGAHYINGPFLEAFNTISEPIAGDFEAPSTMAFRDPTKARIVDFDQRQELPLSLFGDKENLTLARLLALLNDQTAVYGTDLGWGDLFGSDGGFSHYQGLRDKIYEDLELVPYEEPVEISDAEVPDALTPLEDIDSVSIPAEIVPGQGVATTTATPGAPTGVTIGAAPLVNYGAGEVEGGAEGDGATGSDVTEYIPEDETIEVEMTNIEVTAPDFHGDGNTEDDLTITVSAVTTTDLMSPTPTLIDTDGEDSDLLAVSIPTFNVNYLTQITALLDGLEDIAADQIIIEGVDNEILDVVVTPVATFDDIEDPSTEYDQYAYVESDITDRFPASLPTLAAHTPVQQTADDAIDAAVEAYSDLADIRYAAEEASLELTLSAGRSVFTSTFDDARAVFTALKQAEIAEYDKGLRVRQAEMNHQAAVRHQELLLQEHQQRTIPEAQLHLGYRTAIADLVARFEDIVVRDAQFRTDLSARINIEDTRNSMSVNLADAENSIRGALLNAQNALAAAIKNTDSTNQALVVNKQLTTQAMIESAHTLERLGIARLEAMLRAAISDSESTLKALVANASHTVMAEVASAENFTRCALTTSDVLTRAAIATVQSIIQARIASSQATLGARTADAENNTKAVIATAGNYLHAAMTTADTMLRAAVASADNVTRASLTNYDGAVRLAVSNADALTRASISAGDMAVRGTTASADNMTRANIANASNILHSAVSIAENATRISLANVDATTRVNLANAENQLRADISTAEHKLRIMELQGRYTLADLENQMRTELANSEIERINIGNIRQSALDKNEQTMGELRLRTDVANAFYNVTLGWMNAKTSNASALSHIITTGMQQHVAQTHLAREFDLNAEKQRWNIVAQRSGLVASSAELKWKSMLQNMMVIKEATNIVGLTSSGSEYHPSNFSNTNDTVSSISNIASSALTLVSLLG